MTVPTIPELDSKVAILVRMVGEQMDAEAARAVDPAWPFAHDTARARVEAYRRVLVIADTLWGSVLGWEAGAVDRLRERASR